MTPVRQRENVKKILRETIRNKGDTEETSMSYTPCYYGFIKVYQNLLDTYGYVAAHCS